jgi:hypothetical protein
VATTDLSANILEGIIAAIFEDIEKQQRIICDAVESKETADMGMEIVEVSLHMPTNDVSVVDPELSFSFDTQRGCRDKNPAPFAVIVGYEINCATPPPNPAIGKHDLRSVVVEPRVSTSLLLEQSSLGRLWRRWYSVTIPHRRRTGRISSRRSSSRRRRILLTLDSGFSTLGFGKKKPPGNNKRRGRQMKTRQRRRRGGLRSRKARKRQGKRQQKQAREEAAEQARKEAEEQARREAEEQARREAGELAKWETEELAKREAEELAKREAEEQTRQEARG